MDVLYIQKHNVELCIEVHNGKINLCNQGFLIIRKVFMYKEEINRIWELFSHLYEIDIENDVEQIRNAGFNDINDYNFIKDLYDKCNNFMQYIAPWNGLEERIPTIQKTIILICLLKQKKINI